MSGRKHEGIVEALDYLGGEYGFCEPLVIRAGETEKYVLHSMRLVENGSEHRKIEFSTKCELLADWNKIKDRLSLNPFDERWTMTTANCGYDVQDRTNPLWQGLTHVAE